MRRRSIGREKKKLKEKKRDRLERIERVLEMKERQERRRNIIMTGLKGGRTKRSENRT